jgi:diguanylate cyclase (GGDEF)-like protein
MIPIVDDSIRAALGDLETRIADRVRLEQLVDQLTRLPNGAALQAAILERTARNERFWLAFVEIDEFKRINDRHGYENADALLVKVAEQLRSMCSWFPGTTSAFRPHGDEFYLLGALGADDHDMAALGQEIEANLDLVRQGIGATKVSLGTDDGPTTASCTVSIGWLADSDLVGGVSTLRALLSAVERAVGEAKWLRDRVIRYNVEMEGEEQLSLRADCPGCRCKFSFHLKRSSNARGEDAHCPNCGNRVTRPPEPQPRTPARVNTV